MGGDFGREFSRGRGDFGRLAALNDMTDFSTALRHDRTASTPDSGPADPGGAARAALGGELARIASRQQGVVTRAQLQQLGFTRHGIATGLSKGRLHRVYRGVYLVGHTAEVAYARERAALLVCGEGAVLSHQSAALAWSLLEESTADEVDVTVMGRHVRSKPGLRVHRVDHLADEDLSEVHGLPVTAPARTIIDVAVRASGSVLERAVSEARIRRLVAPGDLEGALQRSRNRAGSRRVRNLLARESVPTVTRSEAERRLRALLRHARLPQPHTNMLFDGYELDFCWPKHRLVVEVDGYPVHGQRTAFERDRARDAALVAAGYRVIRVTWRQLTEQPLLVVANLARALAIAPAAAA